jgi:subtilisin family serine protease
VTRRQWTGYLLVTALVTTVGLVDPAGARAAPEPARPAGWTAGTADRGTWVTLLTGDRVYVDGDNLSVTAAPGRERIGFVQRSVDGHHQVIPADALRLVGSGALDARLFDVTGLVRAGYDDARSAHLPAIVGYTDQAAGSARLRASGDARVTRVLPSVRGAAVRVEKAGGSAFWSSVTTGAGAARRLAGGVARIWLDGVRTIDLDQSVPQIGAPQAWAAGYDGTGVTVAVLDTGVDATHPDLAGRIVEARNFTDAPDTTDTVGHGTHVAATVAGTGAGSAGKYKGVAPGAELLIGKVCPTRDCPDSAILAGMEWAAPRAKVVNLSLGGPDTPALDPLEEAVNRLSAQTGALFVIAAGNNGRDGGVGSPSTADAALSVGAVDKQDNLATFSDRGPRWDGAIKPEITAPGVGIVAALSKDSPYPVFSPGYTQLNGTSMATPHVAGAAALLAGQHPGWTAGRLKAALTAAATPNPAVGVHAQGAGRVDVGRAVRQAVLPSPASIGYGAQPWPADDDAPTTRTVTYRNDGPDPVTLDLAAQVSGPDGKPAPAGMITAVPARVTVPAGGTADVAVTADTRVPSATGLFQGAVVGTSAGGVAVRVPVTVSKGHESRTLTVKLIDRNGAPAADYDLSIVGVDFDGYYVPYHASGTVPVRLRAGRYHVQATIVTPGADEGTSTLLVAPAVTVSRDGELVLDARKGTPVKVTVPHASARPRSAIAGLVRNLPSGYQVTGRITGDSYAKLFTADLGAVPADAGTLTAEVRGFWAEPTADGTFFDSPYEYDLVWFVRGKFLTNFTRKVRRAELATVENRFQQISPGTRRGFMHNFGFPPEGGGAMSGPIQFTVPGKRTIYYSARDVVWKHRWEQMGDQNQLWSEEVNLKPGKRYLVKWQEAPAGPNFNTMTFATRTGDTLAVNVPPFGDRAGNTGYSLLDTGTMALYRDGVKFYDFPKYFYDARGPVPPAESTYRLEYQVTRGAAAGFELGTSISGSWTFRSARVAADKTTYLPLAGFHFRPTLDLANRAEGGRLTPVPLSLGWQPGAAKPKVRSLTVDVSYDDGAGWRRVPLTPAGRDGWTAWLRPPAKGHVSLRAGATFSDGGAADYTALRAYGLR